jgi:hypothetical protein
MREDRSPMSTNNSLINLGDFGPAAKAVVDAIANGIGTLYLPTHLVKIAEAEAKAHEIKKGSLAVENFAINELVRTPREAQALLRLIHEETKRQENIDDVVSGCLEFLGDSSAAVKSENLDPEWLSTFFKLAKDIDTAGMRKLWSAVLARQAVSKDGFSAKTLSTLSLLSSEDAILFTTLCRFWITGPYHGPYMTEQMFEYARELGLDTSGLHHLQSLGLVNVSSLGYTVSTKTSTAMINYADHELEFKLVKKLDEADSYYMHVGKVIPTQVACELYRVLEQQCDTGVLTRIKANENFIRS